MMLDLTWREGHDEDAKTGCCAGWSVLGIVAGVLCIVLAGVADKVVYLELRGPAVAGVDPAAALPGCDDQLALGCPREVEFAAGLILPLKKVTK